MLQGQAYADAGATAYDATDGAISSITVSGVAAINTMLVSMLRLALTSHKVVSVCHIYVTVCYIALYC